VASITTNAKTMRRITSQVTEPAQAGIAEAKTQSRGDCEQAYAEGHREGDRRKADQDGQFDRYKKLRENAKKEDRRANDKYYCVQAVKEVQIEREFRGWLTRTGKPLHPSLRGDCREIL